MFQIALDSLAECFQPVIAHRQPDLECTKTPRQLHRFFEKAEALDRIRGKRLSIIPAMGKRAVRVRRIAEEQAAAIQRLIEPFMGIEGKRVCTLQTAK